MDSKIIREILTGLKNKKGRKIDELIKLTPRGVAPLPGHLYATHYPIDEIRQLARLALIQAYKGRQLVNLENVKAVDLTGLTFYLSPHAVELEEVLGINVSAWPIFRRPELIPSQPDLLMLMPFSPNLKPVFDNHIKKVAASLGISAGRADDFFTKESIMQDIWSAIFHARVIVADCTKRNPNVFYEIGIAHTLGKNTVLISQSLKDIPFDLQHLRYIIYDFTPRGMSNFEQSLEMALASILNQ